MEQTHICLCGLDISGWSENINYIPDNVKTQFFVQKKLSVKTSNTKMYKNEIGLLWLYGRSLKVYVNRFRVLLHYHKHYLAHCLYMFGITIAYISICNWFKYRYG